MTKRIDRFVTIIFWQLVIEVEHSRSVCQKGEWTTLETVLFRGRYFWQSILSVPHVDWEFSNGIL